MLMSRVVKPGNKIESLRENPWNAATMLVFRNEVRTIINNLSVFEHSTRLNQLPIAIVANDQVRRHDIDNAEIRRFLLGLPDNKTEGLPGYLPIVPNMPVLITHNIATELHISNGSIGRLVKVVYEDEEQSHDGTAIRNSTFPSNTVYIRKPLYALVQLPQCKGGGRIRTRIGPRVNFSIRHSGDPGTLSPGCRMRRRIFLSSG